MSASLLLIKGASCAALGLATGIAGLRLLQSPDSPVVIKWLGYVGYLSRSLGLLGSRLSGKALAVAQCLAIPGILAAIVHYRLTLFWSAFCLALALLGPWLLVARLLYRRGEKIEREINGFLVGMANSLKASPSLGKALVRVETVITGPLRDEIGLVLRDLRLGSTVEEALRGLGSRVNRQSMDVALTGLLIGRQVGGNLPTILETIATTLREMERLDGVVKSKTSEGKAQVVVIALMPPGVYFVFDAMDPLFFEPFTNSMIGILLLIIACAFWLTSVILARRILDVDI